MNASGTSTVASTGEVGAPAPATSAASAVGSTDALEVPLGPPGARPGAADGPAPAFPVPSIPPPPAVRVPPFADDADAAELRAAIAAAEADANLVGETSAQLLDRAEARLALYGIGSVRTETREGYPALQVVADDATPLGELARYLERDVDGFRLLYSPEKLFRENTRGAVWGFVRQVVAAHDMILEGRLDPITRHEVEHAVLNVAEEQGRPQRWLGFVQSLDGTALSEVDADVGGYVSYCSLQEVPAYAVQVRLLGSRLAEDPSSDHDAAELEAMARWGRALAGRMAEVAERAGAALLAHPEYAVFTVRRSTPEGRETQVPAVAWASVDHDGVRVKLPLTELASADAVTEMLKHMAGAPEPWAEARAPLLAQIRRSLARTAADAAAARAAFTEIEQLAKAAGEDPAARRRAGRTAARLAV